MKDTMEAYFERIENENQELKDDLEIMRRKKEEAERERNQFKSKFEYLNLKGANTSRRDKTFQQSFDGGEENSIKITEQGVRETSRNNSGFRISEL